MWGIIATWRMAIEGVEEAGKQLKQGMKSGDALETAIRIVEDYPFYKSVGYGGLPNENMEVELDAGFMDGDTLDVGAVAGIRDFANPVSIARALSKEKVNNFLVGDGAEAYAHKHGFERKNMLTDRGIAHYRKRKRETLEKGLSPYSGHDTVAMVALDTHRSMSAATSTSGLFMKRAGRVGDSPMSGSGYYVDSEVGGAGSTGLGEDIMKGCISYEIVSLMRSGMHPQAACEQALNRLDKELIRRRGKSGQMSFVAMNNKGEWGVSTNAPEFSFCLASEKEAPAVYLSHRDEAGHCHHELADKEWLDAYARRIKAPII